MGTFLKKVCLAFQEIFILKKILKCFYKSSPLELPLLHLLEIATRRVPGENAFFSKFVLDQKRNKRSLPSSGERMDTYGLEAFSF